MDDPGPSRRLAGFRVGGPVSSPSKSTTAVVIALEVDAAAPPVTVFFHS